MAEPLRDPDELDLRHYLAVLRRRAWIVVVATVVTVAAALAVSFVQDPLYEGQAEVLVQNRTTDSLFNPNTGQRVDPERFVETEIAILESRPVEQRVAEALGTSTDDLPDVDGRAGTTDIVEVTAEHGEPQRAAALADAYADAYLAFKRQQAVDELSAAAAEVGAKIAALQSEVDALEAEIAQREGVEAETLLRRRDQLVAQQALFRQTLDELQVDSALRSGGAQLVAHSEIPDEPVSPQPLRNGVLGGVVGLLLGVGLAFLVDHLDDTLRDTDDFGRVTEGVALMGVIPAVAGWKTKDRPRVITVEAPHSPAAEAYRSLRTSVRFMAYEQPMRIIQTTSPVAAEGKTTTVVNLGVALARAGHRVLIVDADLRRPRVHAFFRMANEEGFTDLLAGHLSTHQVVQPAPGVDGLSIITSGAIPSNPSEMLSSGRTHSVLRAFAAEWDVVLIDTPPVLPVTDAGVLARHADVVLLVASADITSQRALRKATETLQRLGAKLYGVLNRVDLDHTGYGYAYGYGSSPDDADARQEMRPAESSPAAVTPAAATAAPAPDAGGDATQAGGSRLFDDQAGQHADSGQGYEVGDAAPVDDDSAWWDPSRRPAPTTDQPTSRRRYQI